MRRPAPHAATASSVSARAAAATAAASAGEHGGHRRVLTAPATGVLAITSTWKRLSSAPMSGAACAP